jgi:hypothetical protein
VRVTKQMPKRSAQNNVSQFVMIFVILRQFYLKICPSANRANQSQPPATQFPTFPMPPILTPDLSHFSNTFSNLFERCSPTFLNFHSTLYHVLQLCRTFLAPQSPFFTQNQGSPPTSQTFKPHFSPKIKGALRLKIPHPRTCQVFQQFVVFFSPLQHTKSPLTPPKSPFLASGTPFAHQYTTNKFKFYLVQRAAI